MNSKPTAPESDRKAKVNPTGNRAANAVKHGFSAARFVNPETLALAECLREELSQIHQPCSRAEIEIIAELAQARAQYIEIEKARQIRIGQERASALDRHERTTADALDRDKSAWRQDPPGRVWILSGSYQGAKYLAELWDEVLENLRAGLPLPFDMVCDAVMALGSHWQVDKATGDGLQLMTWHVRTAPDPAHASELWAKESQVRDGLAFARDRVARRLADAPQPAAARREMESLAKREAAEWKSLAQQLFPAYESSRELAPICAVGLGTGDPNLEKDLRLLNRYATSARNKADRIQRRLESLIRNRAIEARRAARESRRDSARTNDAITDSNDTSDDISKRDEPQANVPESSLAGESIPPESAGKTASAKTTQTTHISKVTTALRNETGQGDGFPSGHAGTGTGVPLMTNSMDRLLAALSRENLDQARN